MTTILGSDRVPYRWFLKWVGRRDRHERKIRLFRLVWSRKGGPGTGVGWSSKLTLNLAAYWLQWHRDSTDFYVTFCGIQIHKQRHWGGWIQ